MTSKYLFCLLLITDIHASQVEAAIFGQNFNTSNNNIVLPWYLNRLQAGELSDVKLSFPFIFAGILSFIAAVISSIGGLGGGGLFIPILTIFTGLDLKTASTFSAFMVTGGSISNVFYRLFDGVRKRNGRQLINYEIALLTEPCLLLGVSCGVICNRMFPNWLITVIFAIFLGFSTFKTCESGFGFWKSESEGIVKRNGRLKIGNEEDSDELTPFLEAEGKKLQIPWMTIGMLIIIWFSYLLLYLLRGNRYGQGIIDIPACGKIYWMISSIQFPLTAIFTVWIVCKIENPNCCRSVSEQKNGLLKLIFPVMALLVGILGGLFGIGGGLFLSPLLIQMGMEPEAAAATSSFMVLFSSSMSAIQYLLMGMEEINGALIYALICFVGSIVGLTLVKQAIMKHGRASIIVFAVSTAMAFSSVLIIWFGAMDIWKDYVNGESMGFRPPC